ncbi:hypothetical protein NECAME_02638, partial [Necator americanus]
LEKKTNSTGLRAAVTATRPAYDSTQAQHCVITSQLSLGLRKQHEYNSIRTVFVIFQLSDMETLLIRSPSKRQRDCIHDPCDIPLKRSCRQEGNDATFTCGCDELPFSPYSNRFTVRNLDGVEKSLELDDLVDMVLQVAKDVEDSNIAEHVVNLSKRRLQNKMAAARYRDKQKERHEAIFAKGTSRAGEKECETKRNRPRSGARSRRIYGTSNVWIDGALVEMALSISKAKTETDDVGVSVGIVVESNLQPIICKCSTKQLLHDI